MSKLPAALTSIECDPNLQPTPLITKMGDRPVAQFYVQHPCNGLNIDPERVKKYPNGAIVWVYLDSRQPLLSKNCGGQFWLVIEADAKRFGEGPGNLWVCEHMGELIE